MHDSDSGALRVGSASACAALRDRRRPDPERARRRPLLEGVRQPDRARQDAADRRDAATGSPSGSGSTPAFLESGVSADDRGRAEAALARAEALLDSHQYLEALDEFGKRARARRARPARAISSSARLLGESWAHIQTGSITEALQLLAARASTRRAAGRSRTSTARPSLFRLGVCRYKLSSIATALALLNDALELADRSALPCDPLRADILGWRSRCYRRQRDWQAAREDVERALELAAGRGRPAGDGEHLLPGVAGRRARGQLAARALVCGAGARPLRGARRPGERRPPPEQPRRPQLHPRERRPSRRPPRRTRHGGAR